MHKKFFVYILECENQSYYCGYTNDLEKRWQKHLSGKASKYTRAFKPKKISASWELDTKSQAMSLEAIIKTLSRKQKEKLINGEIAIDQQLKNFRHKTINIKKLSKKILIKYQQPK